MLCEIQLRGSLGLEFGETLRLQVRSIGEAIRAISSQRPGFLAALRRSNAWFRVERNGEAEAVTEDRVRLAGEMRSLVIEPLPAGAGSAAKGIITAIIGVVLVAFSFGAGAGLFGAALAGAAGKIGALGVALTLSGISSILAPSPQAGQDTEDTRKASYIFGGPVNTTGQGGPVPIIYGECIVGSQVVSASIEARDVQTTTTPSGGQSSSTGSGIAGPIFSEPAEN